MLLKTALVCVSCIQNTQIRGETTVKGVRESRYVLDVLHTHFQIIPWDEKYLSKTTLIIQINELFKSEQNPN
jgi:hypothetical protein